MRSDPRMPCRLRSNVPLLLAYSERGLQDFHDQWQQAANALCDAGRCAPLLTGDSHDLEIYAIDTADAALTRPMRRFILGR